MKKQERNTSRGRGGGGGGRVDLVDIVDRLYSSPSTQDRELLFCKNFTFNILNSFCLHF